MTPFCEGLREVGNGLQAGLTLSFVPDLLQILAAIDCQLETPVCFGLCGDFLAAPFHSPWGKLCLLFSPVEVTTKVTTQLWATCIRAALFICASVACLQSGRMPAGFLLFVYLDCTPWNPGPCAPPVPPPILFYRRLETCKKYISDWLSPQEAFVHYPSSWDLAVLVNVHIGYFLLIVWCTWRGHFWYFKYILLIILQYISSKRFTAWQDSFSVHPV